ncbi:MAG TPA: MBL fold metallo-hydrolase [Trebonia sp.]|nr:MBL fold metallo-hydrolase [Trebonia sp.]
MTMRATATHIGAATVLLTVGDLRLLTDPALDPAGTTFTIPVPRGPAIRMRRVKDPAVTVTALPVVDAVLLTHDHPDHLDQAGLALAASVPLVLTTPAAAGRLGPNAVGLQPWASHGICRNGTRIRVTATPARHGPPEMARLVGEVTGFAITAAGTDDSAAYISGDTVYYDGLREIGRRFAVDTAFLFLGDAHFPQTGGTAFTMNSHQGAQLADELRARRIVPVHYDSFDHLAEPAEAIGTAFTQAGLGDRLRWLRPGRCEPLTWPRSAGPGEERQEVAQPG